MYNTILYGFGEKDFSFLFFSLSPTFFIAPSTSLLAKKAHYLINGALIELVNGEMLLYD